MIIWRINIGLLAAIFCFGQAQAGTSATQDPVLVPQKAVAAPTYTEIDKSSMPPLAPAIKSGAQSSDSRAPNAVPSENNYPLVSKMEVITFGKEKPDKPIDERLGDLEQEVFRNKFGDQSLFDRTQKLKQTILGPDEINRYEQEQNFAPLLGNPMLQMEHFKPVPEVTYFELVAKSAENQIPVENQELPAYALQLINSARAQLNFSPLIMDEIAQNVAEAQVIDLHSRKLISHLNQKGENPDLRYTNAGGKAAIMESLIVLKPEHVQKNEYTRALVAHAFKLLLERQDDRDSLLSPDATGFGFALRLLTDQKRAVACVEISTNHGAIKQIKTPLKIGEKVEIEGTMEPSYKFAKVTLAWEGLSGESTSGADETEEALPYFPPLDYVGYARKSEHDYGAAKTALKIGLLASLMAGSVFMPPVVLAAPLVFMGPGGREPEPKPISDIPMHGGFKVEENNFSGKIPLTNASKPGIYYITVWAISKNNKLIPVSRRALVLTEEGDEGTSENNAAEDKTEKKANKAAKKVAKQAAKQEKKEQLHKIQDN